MDSRSYVESFLQKNGFSEAKADETIIGTSKVLDSTQYVAASRNRLNSGILRNECVVLLNPISNEDHLNDAVFSGISKLRDDQYVLVQQYPDESLWNVYQGFNSDGMMTLIQKKISLEMFLIKRHLANQNKDASTKILEAQKQINQLHSQIIYYGVPGCGKSNTIKEKLKNVPDFNKVRVVFHPEYTNADFVGQILPVVKNGVSYEFTAGPFTRILAKAYAHPGQNFYLVIEEINRGNAAAIFGDVFQLLDRMKSGESDEVGGNVYGAGWSKYFVDNEDVNTKICEVISSAEYVEGEERPTINFTENTAIRLPPNLSILATMNTSDQNVFTLDNAFQRRFDMKMIENSLDENSLQYKTEIDGAGVCWGDFWKWCNKKIESVTKISALASTQDKCLGGWFVCGEKQDEEHNIPFSKELFAEKVLKYLWDDAFKRDRSAMFKTECTSLEAMIKLFKDAERFAAFEAIFNLNADDKKALRPNYPEA
ncbi:MAG: AAA family ATPase [Fibrobacter sp.]|nr:AAA family ATPase [Fibrobacter sp.]